MSAILPLCTPWGPSIGEETTDHVDMSLWPMTLVEADMLVVHLECEQASFLRCITCRPAL